MTDLQHPDVRFRITVEYPPLPNQEIGVIQHIEGIAAPAEMLEAIKKLVNETQISIRG